MIELDPDKLDIIYAVCSALALRASSYDDIQLENVLKFLLSGNLARDYVMMTIKDMTRNGIVKARLKELPQFEKFLDAYGSTLLSYAK